MISNRSRYDTSDQRPLESASIGELLGQFFRHTSELLKKELELAKSELGSDARSLVAMAVGFAAAGVFALLGLGLLCAAAVLGLASRLPAWEAALIVGFVMLAICGVMVVVARSKRVKKPLERTQRTLKETLQWAKQRTN
jgi:tetrahydromethanopterin S-methyltransferase subunit C